MNILHIPIAILFMTCSMLIFSFYMSFEKTRTFIRKFFPLFIIGISIIVGTRDVGVDTIPYQNFYNVVDDFYFSWELYPTKFIGIYEVGFHNINYISKYIGIPFYAFSSIVTLSFLVLYSYTSKSITGNVWLPLILLISSYSFYQLNFNQVRQGVALGICFLSLKFVLERRIVAFLITIYIASLFHTISLFYLAIYPLFKVNITKRRLILVLLISFLSTQFGIAKEVIKVVVDFVPSGGLHSKLHYYLYSDKFNYGTPVNVSYYLEIIGFFIAAYAYLSKPSLRSEKIDCLVVIVLFGFIVQSLFFDFIIVSQRLMYFFSIVTPLIYASVISNIKPEKYIFPVFSIFYLLFSIKVYYSSVGWS